MCPPAKRAAKTGGKRAAADRISAKGTTTFTRATRSTRGTRRRGLPCGVVVWWCGVAHEKNCALYSGQPSCGRVEAPQRYSPVRPTACKQPRVCGRRAPKRLRSACCMRLSGRRRWCSRERNRVHTVPVICQRCEQPKLLPSVHLAVECCLVSETVHAADGSITRSGYCNHRGAGLSGSIGSHAAVGTHRGVPLRAD